LSTSYFMAGLWKVEVTYLSETPASAISWVQILSTWAILWFYARQAFIFSIRRSPENKGLA
jgi:hypothetical protein